MIAKPPLELEGGTLGLVALGASSFHHLKEVNANPTFKKSKEAFCAALKEQKLTVFADRVEFLDLFNDESGPDAVFGKIEEFKNQHKLSTMLIYYCGHGLVNRDTYVLALKGTKDGLLLETGLRPALIRDLRDQVFPEMPLFLFLDCCYAGEAAEQWTANSRAVRNSGTTIACAAARGEPALAPTGEPLTMFTGSFLLALDEGIRGPARTLSLHEVFTLTRTKIKESASRRKVQPALHSPDQSSDYIADTKLFINRQFDPEALPRDLITYSAVTRMFGFGSERKLTFNNRNIVVKLSLTRLELYVDGNLLASRPTEREPNPNVVLLEGSFMDGNQRHTIKVYGKSSTWQGKLKLLIDDNMRYGDEF